MKAVLISILPKYCELIASGKKTLEIRKTRPKIDTPFKVYIYQSKDNWVYKILEKLGLYQKKVIGEFICDMIIANYAKTFFRKDCKKACLSIEEITEYANEKMIFGWHISDLKIYDKPKELSEFRREGDCGCGPKAKHCPYFKPATPVCEEDCDAPFNITLHMPVLLPPQSWCYVEELGVN